MDAVDELEIFLKKDSVATELKKTALNFICGMSATNDGVDFILNHQSYLSAILKFAKEESDLTEVAHKCLINLTSTDKGVLVVFSIEKEFFQSFLDQLCIQSELLVQSKCQILANASRSHCVCENLASYMLSNFNVFQSLINCYNSSDFKIRASYDYLSLFFGNLPQNNTGMKLLFEDRHISQLKSIISYTSYVQSEIRRFGSAILLKNICFEYLHHGFILKDLEILPLLLMPLIGCDDLDEDEMDKLPIVCQYLGENKTRESNCSIRVLLLEALLKLCCTKFGRNFLRDNGVYYVLRELHKWEQNSSVLEACENVIEILIREESDIAHDNFMEINVPEHLAQEFNMLSVNSSEMPQVLR